MYNPIKAGHKGLQSKVGRSAALSGCPGGTQTVNNLAAKQKPGFNPWLKENPLEKGTVFLYSTIVFLPGIP